MPAGPRSTSRPGAGPGRGKPRARTPARTPASPANSARTSSVEPKAATGPVAAARRSSLTARAIALAVVFLILTISYASSLRIYFAQSHEIAATKVEITERQSKITTLQQELARWNDPAYVRTQARERLGWVVPGETGFKVVGADGKPIGGGAEINSETAPTETPQDAWWSKMWGSVEAADKPAPAKAKPAEPKPITTKTKPTR